MASAIPHKGGWDQQKYERAAETSGVHDQLLYVLCKDTYDDSWGGQDDWPYTLHDVPMGLS